LMRFVVFFPFGGVDGGANSYRWLIIPSIPTSPVS